MFKDRQPCCMFLELFETLIVCDRLEYKGGNLMRIICMFVFIILLLLLSACNDQTMEHTKNNHDTTSNPTADDILSNHKDADIFVINDTVYSKALENSWVHELDVQLGDEVAEITLQTDRSQDFNNGTASKLPKGTKIYESVDEQGNRQGLVLIAVVNGEEIRYLALIEG